MERVLTVLGNKATRPLSDFIMSNIGLGKTFYVDSNHGDDGRSGRSPETCLATLDAAIGKCTADHGDVVYLLPGHAESEAVAATSIATMDIAGVTVIGLGDGDQMPTFSLGVADATFTISAPDCLLRGVRIKSTVADVAVGITMSALSDNTIIDGCVFRDDGAAKELLAAISITAAANGITIKNCDFRTTAAAGSANAILSAAVTDLNLIKNTIYGKYSAGGILTSGVITRSVITDNVVVNAEAAIAIALNGTTSTGILARNLLGGTTSIAAALTGDNAMWCFENYVTGAAAASGLIDPAVDGD